MQSIKSASEGKLSALTLLSSLEPSNNEKLQRWETWNEMGRGMGASLMQSMKPASEGEMAALTLTHTLGIA